MITFAERLTVSSEYINVPISQAISQETYIENMLYYLTFVYKEIYLLKLNNKG